MARLRSLKARGHVEVKRHGFFERGDCCDDNRLNANGAFASVDVDDPDTGQGKTRAQKRLISFGWNRAGYYGAILASRKKLEKKK
jgi:hypothetical protein